MLLYPALKADYKELGAGFMTFRYAGFISYAHADEAIAAKLHRALETYAIPKSLKPKENRAKLSPIFRDTAELTAHHSLSEKIREGVQSSRFLIVLCSPDSKESHWVNEEIKLFRQLHGEGSILCALIEGTPQTSFPPALLEGGREPLAANMTGRKESFRFGITQMAAAMLGVGLDELVQRDARRRRNRLRVMSAASLTFAAIMGGMAWTAIDARDAAEVSRSEAENMVEYLITDLKKELNAVGRLSILDDVGTRVTDYYDAIPLSDMDDERLTRQARARHILGEVAVKQGRLDHALTELTASYAATEEYLRRNPDNPEAIFAHAQSEYWVGKVYLEQNAPDKALPSRLAYRDLSKRLYEIDPDNRDYVFEYGWAENSLGYLFKKLGNFELALKHYRKAVSIFQNELQHNSADPEVNFEIASLQRNIASAELKQGRVKEAKENLLSSVKTLSELNQKFPDNKGYLYTMTSAELWLQEIYLSENECREPDIHSAANSIKSLIKRDPTNETWKKEYLQLIRIASENCHSKIEKQWLDQEMRNALTTSNQIENKNIKVLDNIAWLESFQTKLRLK